MCHPHSALTVSPGGTPLLCNGKSLHFETDDTMSCLLFLLIFTFYRATANTAAHDIAMRMLSVRPSVVKRVICEINERNVCQHSYTT